MNSAWNHRLVTRYSCEYIQFVIDPQLFTHAYGFSPTISLETGLRTLAFTLHNRRGSPINKTNLAKGMLASICTYRNSSCFHGKNADYKRYSPRLARLARGASNAYYYLTSDAHTHPELLPYPIDMSPYSACHLVHSMRTVCFIMPRLEIYSRISSYQHSAVCPCVLECLPRRGDKKQREAFETQAYWLLSHELRFPNGQVVGRFLSPQRIFMFQNRGYRR